MIQILYISSCFGATVVASMCIATQPQPASPSEVAASLTTAHGATYAQQRSELLSATQAHFDGVVAALRAQPASSCAGVLADALSTRRVHSEWAAEFDDLATAAVTGAKRDRKGQFQFQLEAITADQKQRLGILAVEYVIKQRGAELGLRKALLGMFPPEASSTLALLESENFGGGLFDRLSERTFFPVLARQDSRLPAAMVIAYEQFRAAHPEDYVTPHRSTWRLQHVDTLAALNAMRQIVAIERARMEQGGFAPWNDNDARSAHQAAILQKAREIREAKVRNQPLVPQREAELDAAIVSAKARWGRYAL